MSPSQRHPRLSLPTPLVAAIWGSLLGLVTFAVVALLWRAGAVRAAGTLADSAFLLALICLAGTVLLGQPAKRRRARVPVNRALPHAWWPKETDPLPVIVACVGAPLILGAGAAVLLFR